MASVRSLVGDPARNARIGWLFVAVIAILAAASLPDDGLLWTAFAVVVAVILAAPAVVTGDRTAMVPWPLAAVPAVALFVRLVGYYPEISGYVAVAATAIVIVVELDRFTAVEMSRRFAVGFAVTTTMAVQAVWTVAQFSADRWLGTNFLRGQRELQWDFVHVTVAGLVLGIAAVWLFGRVTPNSREVEPGSPGGRP